MTPNTARALASLEGRLLDRIRILEKAIVRLEDDDGEAFLKRLREYEDDS